MGDGDKKCWVGFDLGATKMLALVFNAKFEAVGERRRKTKAAEGGESGLDRIRTTIEQALEETHVSASDLAGIGVATPGPLDLDKGVLLESPNMGWDKMPLKKTLEKDFNCPVVVINDVDAGVYGEYRFGAAQNARCVVGVFPGTGIGGGCVYEGRIIRGKSNSCFEIGHMQVVADGPLCGCGQRGCLEAVASRLAIAAQAAAAAARGAAPNLLKEAGTDLANIRSSALAKAVAAGDKEVEQIIRAAAHWLGIGIANVVNLMAPDIVVLGGGLVEAMPEIFRDEVRHVARDRAMPALRDCFEVAVAKLGDAATATGAAAWAKESVTTVAKG
jgi:glucokinase